MKRQKNLVEHRRKRLRVGLSCAAVFVLSMVAAPRLQADVIIQTNQTPLLPTDWAPPETLNFNQFDPALGVLQSVGFRVDAQIEGDVQIENVDSNNANQVSYTFAALFDVLRPDNSSILSVQPTDSGVASLAAFDGVIDWTGTSGTSFNNITNSLFNTIISININDLNLFTGVGTIPLTVTAVGQSQVIGESGKVSPVDNINQLAQATVTLTYNYAPIPEPSTLLFLGVAFFLRYIKRKVRL